MRNLQIESTAYCNAKCVFCPVPKLKRPRGTMSMDLFKAIIDDAADLKPDTVLPFLNGEPFMDAHIFERVAYINEKIPRTKVMLYTNGNLLTEERARELSKLDVHAINWSANAIYNEDRLRIMGLELDESVDNILRYQAMAPTVLVAGSMLHAPQFVTANDAAQFRAWCEAHNIMPRMFMPGNWAGLYGDSYTSRAVCCRPGSHMTVLWDGRVSLCCFDAEGQVILGDLNRQTITEVWENGSTADYREKNAKGERAGLRLCGNCTTI